jgi:hypothetical protein
MLRFKNEHVVYAECDQCSRLVLYLDAGAQEHHEVDRANYHADLCAHCRAARQTGIFRYFCEGCEVEVTGRLPKVRLLLNCFGKAFCSDCRTAFFGRYDPRNKAIAIVIRKMRAEPARRNILREFTIDPEHQRREYDREIAYNKQVRALSRQNLRLHASSLNPKQHPIGVSGQKGAYQLDHIVPVSVCFAYDVTARWAASIHNLQIVPWFVNASRNNHFNVDLLVGWAGGPQRRSATDVRRRSR